MAEIREGSADRISAGGKEETKALHVLGIYMIDCHHYICQILISKGSNCVMSVFTQPKEPLLTLRDRNCYQVVLYSFLCIIYKAYDNSVGVSPIASGLSGLLG